MPTKTIIIKTIYLLKRSVIFYELIAIIGIFMSRSEKYKSLVCSKKK